MYAFFNNIYNLQFGFKQQYSTSHALINITPNIRKALDDGNLERGDFVDFWYCRPLVAKLNHYGIGGVSNDLLKSCLSNRNEYLSINGYDFGLAAISCDIPQGPLRFLLYTNDLNQAIKFCNFVHFVDDTNVVCLINSKNWINKSMLT